MPTSCERACIHECADYFPSTGDCESRDEMKRLSAGDPMDLHDRKKQTKNEGFSEGIKDKRERRAAFIIDDKNLQV